MDDLYIKKVLSGEVDEFRYFVRKYKDMAFSVAISVVKDENKAAEVVQEAFINAYRNLKKFKGKSKFSSWFYRIVINESFKTIGKQGEELLNEMNTADLSHVNFPEIFNTLQEGEQKYYINKSLIKLMPNESLVLRLFYLNENSIREICEMTGWSESNVKVLLHRARKHMKTVLLRYLQKEAKYLI